ncbi:hypothetical protein BU14_0142s0002 [Porphyra umbilicalis]|uniref:Uncharacterized protein n=1 Tax=Porphyra umbilicalis TaxID=2786 RepID=A0A1X6PA15_PORUM|nr:hypothetical protein BU14_0142s0002 [Porphyra umbilicalis]|eukprot:OSX77590.1 hypothetical protein BU14_0142s0002 [Porphyra umbilicalis]
MGVSAWPLSGVSFCAGPRAGCCCGERALGSRGRRTVVCAARGPSRRRPRWRSAWTPRIVPVERPAAGAWWLRLGPPPTVTATARPLDWHCQRLPTLPSSRSRRRRLQSGLGGSSSGSWWLRFGPPPTFTATPRPRDRHCRRLPTPPSPLSTQPPPAAADNGYLEADARPTGASPLPTRLTARDGCLGLWPLTRGTCRVFAASATAPVRRTAG